MVWTQSVLRPEWAMVLKRNDTATPGSLAHVHSLEHRAAVSKLCNPTNSFDLLRSSIAYTGTIGL